MNLAAANLTLRNVDLGALDAEADRRLSEYFVKTPYVESALAVLRTHFLGRKGSGKSSLFTQLERLFRESGVTSTKVLRLTPDQYAWTALKEYREQGLSAEQAHTNAWKFTVAIEAAAALAGISEDSLRSDAARTALATLRRFIGENYGGAGPSLLGTATRLLKGIKSFNLSAFGFGMGLQRSEAGQQPITPLVVEALLESVAAVANEVGVIASLDKLDDSWDGSDQSQNLLVGLLKAAKEINDKYSVGAPKQGMSVIVFLRSDIYEGLRFDDKDKHRAAEQSIVWDAEQLREMVLSRLPKGVTVDELFEPGEMRGSISPFNYVVKRTFLRPREVLQFLLECIRRAGPNATAITKDQVRDAEDKYSSWKVEDLKQEYRRLYPEFDQMLEALRQSQHRYDSLAEFENHLQQRIPDLVGRFGMRQVVERLFNASAIGVRLGNAGTARFRCEDSDLVLPAEGAVYVHQSLYRGLNIREKRAIGEAE